MGILAEGTTNAMETVTATMSSVMELGIDIFDKVIANPVLCFVLAGSLLGVGVAAIKKLKRVAN